VLHMAERYHEDLGHIQRATDIALELFDQTEDLHGLDIGARDLLEAAGLLHNVGLFISHAAHHKHSYYVIRQSDQLSGFTDAEIEMIAQVARYHRKSEPKATHADFQSLSDVDQGRVRTLAGLLRIGIALDRTRQGGVEELVVTADDRTVTVGVRTRDEIDFSLELYTANQRSSLLSTAIDRDVSVELIGLP
jgi:exopolyphosphatase/guanosine-5'-triphosphate,3'-diphosphate pyrophosphatase